MIDRRSWIIAVCVLIVAAERFFEGGKCWQKKRTS